MWPKRSLAGILVGAILAACRSAPREEFDHDFAAALTERGWLDCAQDMYARVLRDPRTPPEERSEAEYGLLRLEIRQSLDPRIREIHLDSLAARVRGFLDLGRNWRHRSEAVSELVAIHQAKARHILDLCRRDPTAQDRSEPEFDAAEWVLQEYVDELNRSKPEWPESTKNKAKMENDEAWEQERMLAKYNLGAAVFARAEAYRGDPAKRAKMKSKLEELNKLFYDFAWEFPQYLLVYECFLLMGRACRILAESADRAGAESLWKQCFDNFRNARSLSGDPQNCKIESVQDLARRACYYEVTARVAYAKTLDPAAAEKECDKAVRFVDECFMEYPWAARGEWGDAIRKAHAEAKRMLLKPH